MTGESVHQSRRTRATLRLSDPQFQCAGAIPVELRPERTPLALQHLAQPFRIVGRCTQNPELLDDNIDVATASERGVYVANCPGKNSVAVAELAFGMILALDRRIPDNVADLRAGTWNKKEYSKAKGLYGRTLGLLGFGNIGQEMAKRAQAFGLNLAVWSEIGVEVDRTGLPVDLPLLVRLRPSSGYPVEPRVRVCGTPEEVAEHADIVSVHLALNDRTRGLVGRNIFEKMRPGSSRSPTRDQASGDRRRRRRVFRRSTLPDSAGEAYANSSLSTKA